MDLSLVRRAHASDLRRRPESTMFVLIGAVGQVIVALAEEPCVLLETLHLAQGQRGSDALLVNLVWIIQERAGACCLLLC